MQKSVAEPDPNPVVGIGRGTDYAKVTEDAVKNAGGIDGIIKKGDTVFMAAYVRASAGQLPEIGVHMANSPWTPITTTAPALAANKWTLAFSSGVATADYKAADVNVGMQLGKVELHPFERTITVPAIVVERPGQTKAQSTAGRCRPSRG